MEDWLSVKKCPALQCHSLDKHPTETMVAPNLVRVIEQHKDLQREQEFIVVLMNAYLKAMLAASHMCNAFTS